MKYLITRSPVEITTDQRSLYNRYLHSARWRALCDLYFQKSGFRCRLCNGSGGGLVMHHRTYKSLGNEKAMDLIVLCVECHDFFHANKTIVTEKRTRIVLLRMIMNTIKEEIIAFDKKDTQAIFHTRRKTLWKKFEKHGLNPITTILDEKDEVYSKVYFVPRDMIKEVI